MPVIFPNLYSEANFTLGPDSTETSQTNGDDNSSRSEDTAAAEGNDLTTNSTSTANRKYYTYKTFVLWYLLATSSYTVDDITLHW